MQALKSPCIIAAEQVWWFHLHRLFQRPLDLGLTNIDHPLQRARLDVGALSEANLCLGSAALKAELLYGGIS